MVIQRLKRQVADSGVMPPSLAPYITIGFQLSPMLYCGFLTMRCQDQRQKAGTHLADVGRRQEGLHGGLRSLASMAIVDVTYAVNERRRSKSRRGARGSTQFGGHG
ncbi:hypothetical protein, partial [Burkholderia ubonensis]|uniref:hypothetical protein n=1 Tax=Burkholderia ubonensis TaxID=101571 RepID=UPI001E4FF238